MGADVKFEVVYGAVSSASSTVDFTISGFGTPVAAIITATNGTTTGTAFGDDFGSVRESHGIWTSSAQASCGIALKNSVTTMDNSRAQSTSRCIVIPLENGSATEREYTGSAITDGIRLTRNKTWTGTLIVQVTLIGGADVSAAVHTTTYNSSSITGMGFTPVAAYFMSIDYNSTVTTTSYMAHGWATNHPTRGVEQGGLGYVSTDGVGTSTIGVCRSSNYVLPVTRATSTSLLRALAVTGMSSASSGTISYSVTGSNSDSFYALSLGFANTDSDDDFGVGHFSRDKALGVVDYSISPTNTAGTPIKYANILAYGDGPNLNTVSTTTGYGKAIAVVDINGTSHCIAPHEEDNAAVSNNGKRISSDFTISNDAQTATFWGTFGTAESGTSVDIGTLGSNAWVSGFMFWYSGSSGPQNVYQGSSAIDAIYQGSTEVAALYKGSTQLY